MSPYLELSEQILSVSAPAKAENGNKKRIRRSIFFILKNLAK
jgi:hypothetical protein